MEEQQSDRMDQGVPGSESDQNTEEPSAGEQPRRRPADSGDPDGGDSAGESKEGSQSTGHPDSAG